MSGLRHEGEGLTWHFSAVLTAPSNVGYRGQSGRHMLVARFSHFDPNRSFGSVYATYLSA
jgi:hypothetical protein